MHGDFSRWTFDRRAGYRSVLLQQGRVLLDADFNEQTQITAHHDEVRTRDAVGPAGGPLGNAAFGITDAAGAVPSAAAWNQLRLTPGRFYVDGVLVEVETGAGGAGPSLEQQPFLPGAPLPGLPEPAEDGRYAVVLDVWSDHVTADEAPQLRESALGGPDTTTRGRTVWQVRLRKVGTADACAAVVDAPWLRDTPATMTASLADVPADSDPCRITTSAGYRRLENQLYRVEIHDVDSTGKARYLWSRENGSVVAGLTAIGTTTIPGMDAELTLDREGRDEELSIGPADIVEVTSAGRRLHGLPGHLARTGPVTGTSVPVDWIGTAPASLAALGRAPIVRRWEGEPRAADASKDALEDGIEVRFGTTGSFRPGDHWMIPARTVRLVYGQSALAGTIEWPTDTAGAPLAQPPIGPVHHRATVALLERTTSSGKGVWKLASDCRRLTPALTALVGIDLLGGDGQEAVPGKALEAPVRVVVRNGAVPVPDVFVRFDTAGGHLAAGVPTTGDPARLGVKTSAAGQAEARWLLDDDGPVTQLLTVSLLDDGGAPVGAEVRVTARLAIADEIAYDPKDCSDLKAAGAATVQEAIDALCARPSISFPGIHVKEVVAIADKEPLENDSQVLAHRLAKGILVNFDEPIADGWAKDPVMRVTVDVPWPADSAERTLWGDPVVGTQAVALDGAVKSTGDGLAWTPATAVVPWLDRLLDTAAGRGRSRVLTRVTVLGNAVASEGGERFLNGRAFGRLLADGRIALDLPSVDDVHGADFTMWFWLERKPVRPPEILAAPMDLTLRLEGAGEVVVTNIGGEALDLRATTKTISPSGANRYIVNPPAKIVQPNEDVTLGVMATQVGQSGATGELILSSPDPRVAKVTVKLTTLALPVVVIPVREGIFKRKELREEVTLSLNPPEGEQPGLDKLQAELASRGEPLRVAVMPGAEADWIVFRDALEGQGIEVIRVRGDAASLVRLAGQGSLVLDAVVGDPDSARALEAAVPGGLLEQLGREP